MKRIVTDLLILFVLLTSASLCLLAQSLSAERFLENVSKRHVGDEVERDQFLQTGDALTNASASEVERQLPVILTYSRNGNLIHNRAYAVGFLFDIATRPDGAQLLASSAEEVSGLLRDSNPEIQNAAVAVTDYVIGRAETNRQPYLTALQEVIQRPQTPQSVCIGIAGPLLTYGSSEPGAVQAVVDFMQRSDLTPSTRSELVHSLGTQRGLPEGVVRALVKELDDPDPRVRIDAVVAFADSTTEYHAQAREKVARMANDSQEDARVREVAKQAMAGKTHLDPNIGSQPESPNHP